MAKKIEILENTLLKLLVRRGDDVDRKNVVLSEGELGYTTDGKRLYVGDGQGRVLTAGNDTITINDTSGTIVVGTLSANNIHANALGNSLEIDTIGRVALSSTNISVDRISPNSTTYLNLPQKLSINAVDYTFPVGGVGSNKFLGTDVTGNLTWRVPDQASTFFFNSTAGPIPVGTIMTYPDLYAVIGSEYGGNATNFVLPKFTNSALYGVDTDPAGSTTYNIGTGTGSLSAKGALFIIKAIPDSLVQSTVGVKSPLTLSVNGTATTNSVSPLSGNIVISTVVPGVTAFDTAGSHSFITQAEYTKVWVTGSGAKGGSSTGGAAATVYGILSAPLGTQFDVTVAAGRTGANNQSGNLSEIKDATSTTLLKSDGAAWVASVIPDGNVNSGTLLTSSDYVLGGYIIPGGRGGWDTNNNGEDVGGTASFWGSDNVPGAGAGGHNGDSIDTVDGLVKFEWGL